MSQFEVPKIPPEVFESWPLEAQEYILALQTELEALRSQINDLLARLNQNSQNSSKPPSSDPPWQRPPKQGKAKSAKPKGGQVGHSRQVRTLLPPEKLDHIQQIWPDECARCHALLFASDQIGEAVRHQVTELPPYKAVTTEYQLITCECRFCLHRTPAQLPPGVPTGQFGPRLVATVAVLRGQYHLSLQKSQDLLSDLYQTPISLGAVADSCEKVSTALAPAYGEAREVMQKSPTLSVDETSWPKPDGLNWLWVAVASTVTVFRLASSRCRQSLQALIGEGYAGIVSSDRHRAYYVMAATQHQLCWAHLIRNLKALSARASPACEWAETALALTDKLFLEWHTFLESGAETSEGRAALERGIEPIRVAFEKQLLAGKTLGDGKVRGFSREVLGKFERLWLFVKVSGVSPTNNAAERALRPAVIWRKICYGSQSERGERFVERVLTVGYPLAGATCQAQNRSVLTFITASVQANWAGQAAPSLFTLAPTP